MPNVSIVKFIYLIPTTVRSCMYVLLIMFNKHNRTLYVSTVKMTVNCKRTLKHFCILTTRFYRLSFWKSIYVCVYVCFAYYFITALFDCFLRLILLTVKTWGNFEFYHSWLTMISRALEPEIISEKFMVLLSVLYTYIIIYPAASSSNVKPSNCPRKADLWTSQRLVEEQQLIEGQR